MKSNFTNNEFLYNYAESDGGSVKWIGCEPINLVNTSVFEHNIAKYGNDIASTPIYI